MFTRPLSPGYPPRSSKLVGRVLLVASAAALAVSLIFATIERQAMLEQFAKALIYSVSIAVPSALTLNYLDRRELLRNAIVGKVMVTCVLLASAVIGCLIAGLILIVLRLAEYADYWRQFSNFLGFSMVITMTFGFSTTLYEGMRQRLEAAKLELRTREMEQERALKLLAQAQLSSLESRIHPHFLFNTLNSIASLIPSDPVRAEDMVGKLASLLRFSLNANQTGLVPLVQELKIVRDYLEIEKARFGGRLRYTVDVPAELEQVGVPPLAIESLVENSVKHVIAPRPEGGEIRVSAVATLDRVYIDVTDNGPGVSLEAAPPGHGLDNTAARLKLLFGAGAELAALRTNGQATVRVSLPRGPAGA